MSQSDYIQPQSSKYNYVQVYTASIDRYIQQLSHIRSIITPDEVKTAESYRFSRDRNRFIVSRGFLRFILSQYLEIEPIEIKFTSGTYGKPELSSEYGSSLRFNVSHSGNMVVYAITSGREVGVDVENIQHDYPVMDVAGQFFSQAEIDLLASLEGDEIATAFFRCWIRKEAFIKATGKGLNVPLDQFAIPPADSPTAFCAFDQDWIVVEFSPKEGYVAAVVVEGYQAIDFKFDVLEIPQFPHV